MDASGPDGRLVTLVDPTDDWALEYAREADEIHRVLGTAILRIEHIGSTAIPGIKAKPTIDIMVGIRRDADFDPLLQGLESLAYDYTPESGLDDHGRRVFRRGPPRLRTHHLHLTEHEGAYWRRILAFRDYLRREPDRAREYERLKIELAMKFPEDGRSYTRGKHAFVSEIERRAMR